MYSGNEIIELFLEFLRGYSTFFLYFDVGNLVLKFLHCPYYIIRKQRIMPFLNFHVTIQKKGLPSRFKNIFDEAATRRESSSGDSTSPPGGSRNPRFDNYRKLTASCLLRIFAKVSPSLASSRRTRLSLSVADTRYIFLQEGA